jgi:hypothetical protein
MSTPLQYRGEDLGKYVESKRREEQAWNSKPALHAETDNPATLGVHLDDPNVTSMVTRQISAKLSHSRTIAAE